MFVFFPLGFFGLMLKNKIPFGNHPAPRWLCFVLPIKTSVGGWIWNPWEKLCFHSAKEERRKIRGRRRRPYLAQSGCRSRQWNYISTGSAQRPSLILSAPKWSFTMAQSCENRDQKSKTATKESVISRNAPRPGAR